MDVRVFESVSAVASGVADTIVRAVAEAPGAALALPTGRTPRAIYEELRRRREAERVSFARAHFFEIDEFVGVPASHPGSFAAYLRRYVFTALDFDASRIHLLDGTASDLAAECARFEGAIARCGGLDLLVLGIGMNGHIGFNEPGDTLTGPTHAVSLLASTRSDNAALFGGRAGDVPARALTMGVSTLLRAARILLVATGRAKADCVEKALAGPITARVPASLLQTHRAVEVYLDRDAASLLRVPVALVDRP